MHPSIFNLWCDLALCGVMLVIVAAALLYAVAAVQAAGRQADHEHGARVDAMQAARRAAANERGRR